MQVGTHIGTHTFVAVKILLLFLVHDCYLKEILYAKLPNQEVGSIIPSVHKYTTNISRIKYMTNISRKYYIKI